MHGACQQRERRPKELRIGLISIAQVWRRRCTSSTSQVAGISQEEFKARDEYLAIDDLADHEAVPLKPQGRPPG